MPPNTASRLTTLEERVSQVETTLETVVVNQENMLPALDEISQMAKTVAKIWRTVKYVTGAALPTLVAAGYVDGTFARILTTAIGG